MNLTQNLGNHFKIEKIPTQKTAILFNDHKYSLNVFVFSLSVFNILGMTLPAVLSMAVISALCLLGMALLSRKKTSQDTVYTPLMVTSD